jgi:diguanylate cyclase (GGDEF)-like protein
MPISNDKYYKTINKTCYAANIIYLILHVIYLILFIIAKLTVLIYVDAVAVLIYIAFFILLKEKKYYAYALSCGNLYFAFISITTIMMGFNTGFHFYLIGLCVVSFFTTYFSKDKHVEKSLIWVGLSLAIYLTLFFVCEFNEPNYVIDKWLEITLFTINAIVVFAFVAAYLVVFLQYAISLENKIINDSRTDELTQISNRYGLYDYFDQDLRKESRVLALFDIDDFKKINDVYGHVAGDIALRKVAEIATTVLDDAFVCRYGGEEFIIVLTNTDKKNAFKRLEEFRIKIAETFFECEGVNIKLTITIGAVAYRDNLTLEKWVDLADEKMYSGKKTGKNKTVI